MTQKYLRTYQRRETTRESGYHTCEETTGGECRITYAKRYNCNSDSVTFQFARSSLDLVEVFEKGISIIAFGGYVFSMKKAVISLSMRYSYEGQDYSFDDNRESTIEGGNWSNIGLHTKQSINRDSYIVDAFVEMKITSEKGNTLDFISFDFDVVSKEEFLDTSCSVSFFQKTYMHIPYLYYLRSDLRIDWYLSSGQ